MGGHNAGREARSEARYHAWLERCEALPQVRKTLPERERYLTHVEKYASGRARSKVGNAVRRGKSAHDYDDEE